jgi:hypothetical protein
VGPNVRPHLKQYALPFLWTPGQGPDSAAVERLQKHSPRPREPMGEAWFMGEKREMFDYLLHANPSDLELNQLARPLEEVASGNSCFGPMREWHEWLPDPRRNYIGRLVGHTATAVGVRRCWPLSYAWRSPHRSDHARGL